MNQGFLFTIWLSCLLVGCLAGWHKGQTLTGLFFAAHLGPLGILVLLFVIPKVEASVRWPARSIRSGASSTVSGINALKNPHRGLPGAV